MRDLDPVITSVVAREVRVNERLDVRAVIEWEARAGYKKFGVEACGPASLCDEGRNLISTISRHEKTMFELEVDTFF